VILGAIERFIGVLIEHHAGNFPTWLAPVQAIVVTVTDSQIPYARGAFDKLRAAGIRVQSDFRNEKLGFKIREAQLQKIPYMLVVGDKEVENGLLAPRFRDGKNLEGMTPEQFASFIETEVKSYH
jgi:threonyl-tRNA synthetase